MAYKFQCIQDACFDFSNACHARIKEDNRSCHLEWEQRRQISFQGSNMFTEILAPKILTEIKTQTLSTGNWK